MSADLRRSGSVHGFWSVTAHPAIIEMAASVQPDFICLDAQHGTDLSALNAATFTAMDRYQVPGLVRIAQNDPVNIGRALDLGAAGIMAPMVETAGDAEAAVGACHYAPAGSRSFGMQTPRIDPLAAGYRPLCAIQIETAGAVENVEEIAAVDGVDWLYIGPADLGLALTGTPAPNVMSVWDGTHPGADQLSLAFDAVVAAAGKHGKKAGLHTGSGKGSRKAEELGFSVSSVAVDISLIKRGLRANLEDARG